MRRISGKVITVLLGAAFASGCVDTESPIASTDRISLSADVASMSGDELDAALTAVLEEHGFTGEVESTLEDRLGRAVDSDLADVGRLLFFDQVTSLNGDNTCGGCHGPNASFNDNQSIAIGIDNNGVVGPGREGPHNRRRSPTVINSAFVPRLMLDSRFESLSFDPFDNSDGFLFPPPDELSLSYLSHLLAAQAFQPVTDRIEMAGPHFEGDVYDMRTEIARRVDGIDEYRDRFGDIFPAIADGQPIIYDHIGLAIAEFQFQLTFMDAPIDRYARGRSSALTEDQKRGALLFFGKAGCVECHAVAGKSSEMFSDFREHVIGVPQVVPLVTNAGFDGPHENEDFGRANVSGDPNDRYAFRTTPIRNVALQPTFMHNGAFLTLEDAIRHHLDVYHSVETYDVTRLDDAGTIKGGVALGPMRQVLNRLDPRVEDPIELTGEEVDQLVDYVRNGLLDPRARPERLRNLIPSSVPSGEPVHTFEFPVH